MEVARYLIKNDYKIFCFLNDCMEESWIIYIEKSDRDSSLKLAGFIEDLEYNVTKVDICLPGLVTVHFGKGPVTDSYIFVSSSNSDIAIGENVKITYGQISKVRVSYIYTNKDGGR